MITRTGLGVIAVVLLFPASVALAADGGGVAFSGAQCRWLVTAAAVLCLVIASGCGGQAAPGQTELRVWAIGDGAKVSPVNGNLWSPSASEYGGPTSGEHRVSNRVWDAKSNTIRLRSARNEVIGFQLIIEGHQGPVREVTVRVEGELQAEAALFREGYLPIDGLWYADPLVPFTAPGTAPFDIPDPDWNIEGQTNQAVWVDLYVPPEAPPGEREGAIVVTAAGHPEVRVKLALEVLPIVLPAEVHVACDLNCYGASIARQVPGHDFTGEAYLELERAYFRLAHDHRANLSILPYAQTGSNHPGFVPPVAGEGEEMAVADWSGYDQHFGPYFDGSAFEDCLLPARPVVHQYLAFHLCWPSSFEHYGTDRYRQEKQSIARQFVQHAKEKGWTGTEFQVYYNEKPNFGYFPFEMDEPRTQEDLDALAYVSSVVRPAFAQAAPCRFVFRADIYRYDFLREKLGDKVDLFNVSAGIDLSRADWDKTWQQTTGCYDVESLREHQARGGRAWFYGGAGKIDHSLLLNRRFAHRAWRWRADGFCIWCVDGWGASYFPESEPGPDNHVAPYRDGTCGNSGFDFIYYPGEPVGSDGPVPSLRLKAVRRGLQDYEYMWLLAEKLGGDQAAVDAMLCDDQDTDPDAWDRSLDRVVEALQNG